MKSFIEIKCAFCGGEIPSNRKKYCSERCRSKVKYHKDKEKLNKGTYFCQQRRALKRKIELVNLLGGCCSVCGYKKNLSALEFHHTDPTQKEVKLDSRRIGNSKWDKVLEEASKCQLFCANCHRDFHNPQTRDIL